MKKLKIGIMCPSEIAFRRFMPAIRKIEEAAYVAVAHANAKEWFGEGQHVDESVIMAEHSKALSFQKEYGGKIFSSYMEMILSDEMDAIYLPLPPALHFKWAKTALENGKHVFLEKPSTTSAADTKTLIDLASSKNLALHENYMFMFHNQLKEINEIVESGEIGNVRLYRIAFGFPKRSPNDFRYNKYLGGGALLDCGGYTLKLAGDLLGDTAKVVCSQLNYTDEFDVDIYGSAVMKNDEGVTAQIAFGMDNSYKCELEIWGSKGCINTGRIFTAPDGFIPSAEIKIGNEIKQVYLSADDTFSKSIQYFYACVSDDSTKKDNYKKLIKQAELVDAVKGER